MTMISTDFISMGELHNSINESFKKLSEEVKEYIFQADVDISDNSLMHIESIIEDKMETISDSVCDCQNDITGLNNEIEYFKDHFTDQLIDMQKYLDDKLNIMYANLKDIIIKQNKITSDKVE